MVFPYSEQTHICLFSTHTTCVNESIESDADPVSVFRFSHTFSSLNRSRSDEKSVNAVRE